VSLCQVMEDKCNFQIWPVDILYLDLVQAETDPLSVFKHTLDPWTRFASSTLVVERKINLLLCLSTTPWRSVVGMEVKLHTF
jgi:hypothetical protein